jgi:two-component system response regulator FixJ
MNMNSGATNSTPAVHVIDDDAGMRKSIQMLLQSANLKTLVYDSAEAFLDDYHANHCGCIVLDLRMPGIGGIELLQRLSAIQCDMPIIIISGHADVPTAVRGMKLGAVDLLEKPFEPAKLLAAVQHALASGMANREKSQELSAIRQRMAHLTPRELELLKLVVVGSSNKQIAYQLGISIKTVANHRANLMAKTKALNAADLSRLSIAAGIVPGKRA